jgi:hypothetical protein
MLGLEDLSSLNVGRHSLQKFVAELPRGTFLQRVWQEHRSVAGLFTRSRVYDNEFLICSRRVKPNLSDAYWDYMEAINGWFS